jgi:hypothetical protein
VYVYAPYCLLCHRRQAAPLSLPYGTPPPALARAGGAAGGSSCSSSRPLLPCLCLIGLWPPSRPQIFAPRPLSSPSPISYTCATAHLQASDALHFLLEPKKKKTRCHFFFCLSVICLSSVLQFVGGNPPTDRLALVILLLNFSSSSSGDPSCLASVALFWESFSSENAYWFLLVNFRSSSSSSSLS